MERCPTEQLAWTLQKVGIKKRPRNYSKIKTTQETQ